MHTCVTSHAHTQVEKCDSHRLSGIQTSPTIPVTSAVLSTRESTTMLLPNGRQLTAATKATLSAKYVSIPVPVW